MADRVYLVSLCSVRAFLTAVGTRLILTFWGQSCLWLMGWWWRKSRWRIKAGLIASALLTHAPSAERGSLRLSPPQRKPVLSSAAIVWIWLMCPPLTFFLFQIQPLFAVSKLQTFSERQSHLLRYHEHKSNSVQILCSLMQHNKIYFCYITFAVAQ